MKGTPNVVRRGGQIHFRRQVPKHLVRRLGRREIVVSLRTNDVRVGRLRSRGLYIATENLFAALETRMLSEEMIAKVVRNFYDLVGNIDNLNRLSSPRLGGSSTPSCSHFSRSTERRPRPNSVAATSSWPRWRRRWQLGNSGSI